MDLRHAADARPGTCLVLNKCDPADQVEVRPPVLAGLAGTAGVLKKRSGARNLTSSDMSATHLCAMKFSTSFSIRLVLVQHYGFGKLGPDPFGRSNLIMSPD